MEGAAILAVFATYLVPYLVSGIALSHVFGALLIFAAAAKTVRTTSRDATVAFFIFLVMLSLSMASGYFLGPTERFLTEAIKTLIVFFVAYFAGIAIPAERLRAILRPGPWLCVVLIGLVFVLAGNPFSVDGRLTLEGFISPNILGFLIVLNIAVILSGDKLKPLEWMLVVFLTVAMLACFSRSALLGFLAIILVRIGWKWGTALVIGIGGPLAIIFSHNKVIERMLVIQDVMTTGGSGRSDLWMHLMTKWWDTPAAWLFGFGPGSVHRVLTMLSKQEAAHSMVIGSLYYWGLAGFLFLGACLLSAILGVRRAQLSNERTLARDVLLILIMNCLVDESYDGSQVNVVAGLFMAVVVAVIVESRRTARLRKGHSATTDGSVAPLRLDS